MTARAAGRQAKEKGRKPLYPRLLRLQHIAPNAWQRAVLGEGAIGVGVLLAMADVASAWSIVVLPVAVAVVVKAHDALQGLLERPPAAPRQDRAAGAARENGAGPRRGRRRRRRSEG